jgi:general secretion pathway protein A
MSYFKVLGLDKEPFSTNPDPAFFYRSLSHETALKRLEIAIRLRRGLSLILGEVGSGKTTLLRTLLQTFQDKEDFIFHMILDPGYASEYEFLLSLASMLGISTVARSTLDLKQSLERYLYQKGVEEHKTIILLIDEGQKISFENLEVLRMLLNYETNEFKLIQLVIMAQKELLPRIKDRHNLMDRLTLQYTINPLSRIETKQMIEFRLQQAGYDGSKGSLFTDAAIESIYEYTGGYPRKIAMLCHECLKSLVMTDAFVVDAGVIQGLKAQEAKYVG